MAVHEHIDDDFVLIQATWRCVMARDLVERLAPAWVVVERIECGQPLYAVHDEDEALARLQRQGARGEASVGDALDTETSVATLTPSDPEEGAPARAVVVDAGEVLGVWHGRRKRLPHLRGTVTFDAAEPHARALVAQVASSVPLGDTVSLLVSLASGWDSDGKALPLALPVGAHIDVLVQARRGFEMVGRREVRLTVSADAEPLPHQLRLKATTQGPGHVRVLGFHEGEPLGVIDLYPRVIEGAPIEGETLNRSQAVIPASAHPDLSLLIEEQGGGPRPRYLVRLHAPNDDAGLTFKPFGSIELKTDPAAYFRDFFSDIEGLLSPSGGDGATAELRLARKGADLFESLLPRELRETLWSLRGRIASIRVLTDEPWIPWELCKLVGPDGEEGPFLCEGYAMSRGWLGRHQPAQIRCSSIALVVPGDSALDCVRDERTYMLSLAGPGRSVTEIAPRFATVVEALASGVHDCWHFSGHGVFRKDSDPDRACILLEGREELRPQDLSGCVRHLGRAHPLVFFNACQVGRAGMSLTEVGGFARRFMDASASAFVGALWAVHDRAAYRFATTLYDRLLSGQTLGEAAKGARGAVQGMGPSRLAYAVYGNPMARLVSC